MTGSIMGDFEQRQAQPQNSYLASSAKPDQVMPRPIYAENPVCVRQGATGNQAAQRFIQSCPLRLPGPGACPFGGTCHACLAPVQAKLTINKPGDEYEQEADRVADQVMRMPEPYARIQRACPTCDEEEPIQTKPLAEQITPLVQRQVEPEEDEEEEEPIQTKLSESAIQQQEEDPEEGEDEEPVQTKLIEGARVQRQEKPEEDEEEEPVQAKRAVGDAVAATPGLGTNINAMRGKGRPLDPASRAFFEPRFGYDFGQVRVHTNARAAESAKAIKARAFTVGQDVVFGTGRYSPETTSGKRLLAHELAHIVQQQKSTNSSHYHPPPSFQRTRLFVQRKRNGKATPGKKKLITIFNKAKKRFQKEKKGLEKERRALRKLRYHRTVENAVNAFKRTARQLPRTWPTTRPRSQRARVARKLRMLQVALRSYSMALQIIRSKLQNNEQLRNRLRASYRNLVRTIYRTIRLKKRVNIVLVATGFTNNDPLVRQTTAYARAYYGHNSVIHTDVYSLKNLLDLIETTHPEQMISRIDIFCHGLGGLIWFGNEMYHLGHVTMEIQNRAYHGKAIQREERFDRRSVIELHACYTGSTPIPTQQGRNRNDFLTAVGEAIGGRQGQTIVGYKHWYKILEYVRSWSYRGRKHPYQNLARDLYGPNALPFRVMSDRKKALRMRGFLIERFRKYAIRLFDSVVKHSFEVQRFLTANERRTGKVTPQRKVAIMRTMYDASRGLGWLLALQYSGDRRIRKKNPIEAIKQRRIIFTGERKQWRTSTVRIPIEPQKRKAQ